jgi:hypothetical protein
MSLCAVSRWYEGCRNKDKGQLSSALDQISERIMLAFQTLFRPEAIWRSTKQQFTLYFNWIWRRECQSISIDVKVVFHPSTWEPTVLALPAIGPSDTLAASQASAPSSVDLDAAADQAISTCGGDARKARRDDAHFYSDAALAQGGERPGLAGFASDAGLSKLSE